MAGAATPSEIQRAQERMGDAVIVSPCPYSETLSKRLGCHLFLKLENLQPTGSFKVRGALNKIRSLNEKERKAGIICASAGNHAQGVAYAAREAGIRATIVMPETVPLSKVKGTEELGATIVLCGSGYDEAHRKAMDLRKSTGATFIHAFDDVDILVGQGTIGAEILQQVPEVEVVTVPVGGGGLIAGIALAVRERKPKVRVVGVEAALMPAMKASIEQDRIVSLEQSNTIADGVAVATVGEHTYPLVRRYVDDVVTVTEEEIAGAIMVLLEVEKTLAEGAGAVGFAALYNQRINGIVGRTVVNVISGGNIDITALTKILERGLEKDGRLAMLQVVGPDKPSTVALIAGLVADHGANILHISQNRSFAEVNLGQAEVELTLETKGGEHLSEIENSLRNANLIVK